MPQQSSHMLSSLASTWSRSLPASLPPVHMSTRSGAAEKEEKRVTQRAHARAHAPRIFWQRRRRGTAHIPGSRTQESGRADLRERSARRQGRRPDSACRRRAASLPARPKASHLRGVPKSALVNNSAHTQATLQKAVTGQHTAPARTGHARIRARASVYSRGCSRSAGGAPCGARGAGIRGCRRLPVWAGKTNYLESCSASTRGCLNNKLVHNRRE